MNCQWNLADGLTSEELPSGQVISYAIDSTGRVIHVSGKRTQTDNSVDYAETATAKVQYAPHGAIASILLGNGMTEETTYNSRLQSMEIQAGSLLTLGYVYGTTNNNENVQTQTITR